MQIRDLHMTRGWSPGELETNCPCPKAPCGGVSTLHTDPNCIQHAPRFTRTMRNIHEANSCPARDEHHDYVITVTVRSALLWQLNELYEHISDYAQGVIGLDADVQLRRGGR